MFTNIVRPTGEKQAATSSVCPSRRGPRYGGSGRLLSGRFQKKGRRCRRSRPDAIQTTGSNSCLLHANLHLGERSAHGCFGVRPTVGDRDKLCLGEEQLRFGGGSFPARTRPGLSILSAAATVRANCSISPNSATRSGHDSDRRQNKAPVEQQG